MNGMSVFFKKYYIWIIVFSLFCVVVLVGFIGWLSLDSFIIKAGVLDNLMKTAEVTTDQYKNINQTCLAECVKGCVNVT
ncbi:MAG: hypothetical protein R6U15_03740 [Candidatus Izemoplasmatales bacterium]